MASHKKDPRFIRIISNDKQVVCINPSELQSFQIAASANIKVGTGTKDKDGKPEFKTIEADTIRFYFPGGVGLSYSVGIDISKEEFSYICATLLEFLYLNEGEFKARSEAIAKEKMAEYMKISEENEAKHNEEAAPESK
jgi:hypothetical protein